MQFAKLGSALAATRIPVRLRKAPLDPAIFTTGWYMSAHLRSTGEPSQSWLGKGSKDEPLKSHLIVERLRNSNDRFSLSYLPGYYDRQISSSGITETYMSSLSRDTHLHEVSDVRLLVVNHHPAGGIRGGDMETSYCF